MSTTARDSCFQHEASNRWSLESGDVVFASCDPIRLPVSCTTRPLSIRHEVTFVLWPRLYDTFLQMKR